jgi:hypothetical protein
VFALQTPLGHKNKRLRKKREKEEGEVKEDRGLQARNRRKEREICVRGGMDLAAMEYKNLDLYRKNIHKYPSLIYCLSFQNL